MPYMIQQTGESRSFPAGDAFPGGASAGRRGRAPSRRQRCVPIDTARPRCWSSWARECLGVHTGEAAGEEGSNVLGFARYRNGSDAPSPLIELVRQPNTKPEAIAAARAVFEEAGFTVVVCADQPGRIVDRLVRPKYNAALRFLDEGLATRQGHGPDLPARPRLSATGRSSGSSAAGLPIITT